MSLSSIQERLGENNITRRAFIIFVAAPIAVTALIVTVIWEEVASATHNIRVQLANELRALREEAAFSWLSPRDQIAVMIRERRNRLRCYGAGHNKAIKEKYADALQRYARKGRGKAVKP